MNTTADTGVDRARRLGGFAARRGLPLTSCPFDAAGAPADRVLAAAWVRGFLHWRPDLKAISHREGGAA